MAGNQEDALVEMADEQFADGYRLGKFEGVLEHAEAALRDEEDLRGSAERFETLGQMARKIAAQYHAEADAEAAR